MKVRCSYCDSWINDTDEKCPNCDGVNQKYKRATDQTPKTIEELQKWYEAHHLPPQEVTRFFIGVNYLKPRAFGIYRNEKGECVVYKNKDNGTRAIRYQGKDEAYAVNELYQKLKEEILNQKRHNQMRTQNQKVSSSTKKAGRRRGISLENSFSTIMTTIFVLLLLVVQMNSCSLISNRHEGYYRVDDKMLYRYYNTWYEYEDWSTDESVDTSDDAADGYRGRWAVSDEDYDDYEDIWDYHLGKNYDNSSEWNAEIQRFTDSYTYDYAYEEHHSSSSSDSDDYDWDSGSSWDSSDTWDSGSSDWDSDW